MEIVRGAFAMVPGRDEDRFLDVFDPGVEWDMTHRSFNPHVYRGRDGIREWFDQLGETWAEWRSEPEDFLDAGDQVVVLIRSVARGRSSGVEVDAESAALFTFRAGRIVRMKIYVDREEALRDAGLAA